MSAQKENKKEIKSKDKTAGGEGKAKEQSQSKDKKVKDQGQAKGKEKQDDRPALPVPPPRLRDVYKTSVVPALQQRFALKNVMEVPRLEKIVINMGVGKAVQDAKLIDEATMILRNITGQAPVVTRSKKAISNFKLRADIPIGAKVTLRGKNMYEFFDRLVAIAIPRIRDFRGLSRKSCDGRGNYTLGVKEQIVFLEIDRDKVTHVSGMDITICTTAKTDEHCLGLLEEMGMPFRK